MARMILGVSARALDRGGESEREGERVREGGSKRVTDGGRELTIRKRHTHTHTHAMHKRTHMHTFSESVDVR